MTDRAGAGIVIRVERLSEVVPVLESIRSQTKVPRAFVIVTRAAPSAEEAALLQQIEEHGGFVIAEPACSGTEAWSAGLAASPQAGAAAFWLFLDRHDRLVPHYLEAVERVLLHRPEVGIVSCWTAWIDGAQRLEANPCPCGYYGDSQKPCTCAAALVTKYQKRISGPLLDRIDIHIEVPRVDYEKLSGDRVGETSESIRARVQAARDIQNKRFSKNGSSDIICNADMRIGEIRQFCKLPEDGQSLMRAAMSQLNLSARAYHRILKLARTIADLAGCEEIGSVQFYDEYLIRDQRF
jgi:hypothetical protein